MVGDGFGRHTPDLAGVKVFRALLIDSALLTSVSDAIGNLANAYQWVEIGDSVEDVVQACAGAVDSWYKPLMIGQVSCFLGSLPSMWLALDGSTYDADDYPELFALLDAQFKDVGQNEFTLPNVGGLLPMFSDSGYPLGDSGGAVDVALSVDEIPSHNHTYIQPVANVDLEAPGVPDILAAGVGPGTTTGDTGGGGAHENLPPYFSFVVGIFCGRD